MMEKAMSISTETQQAINIAFDSMLKNNVSAVWYFYRVKIYETFMPGSETCGSEIFKRLALITARQVLPIWQNALPDNKRPGLLLDMADGFLVGTISFELMRLEADLFWDYMEEFGSTPKIFSIGNAGYAGEAVAEAVMEVLGKIPYKDAVIEENDTDFYTDVWCGDTAFWAASAFAGRCGAPDVDRDKSKAFWTWWLKEAIPAACGT
jgi:hypothetical protein